MPTNPFYAMLVVVGTLFVLTAFSYTVMATVSVRNGAVGDNARANPSLVKPRRGAEASQPAGASAATYSPGSRALLDFLDKHGVALMAGELALLGAATIGAIGSDGYWTRHAQRKSDPTRGQV